MANRRKRNKGIARLVVALLVVAVIVTGVLCCGFASRTDEGWFKNPDLSKWHWSDPAAEEGKPKDGKDEQKPEENKEPATVPDEGGTPARFFFTITPEK